MDSESYYSLDYSYSWLGIGCSGSSIRTHRNIYFWDNDLRATAKLAKALRLPVMEPVPVAAGGLSGVLLLQARLQVDLASRRGCASGCHMPQRLSVGLTSPSFHLA